MSAVTFALLSASLAASDGGINHGIYGGFNPQWVCPAYPSPTNALVTLTVGSAIVDGVQTFAHGAPMYPFPDDIPAITPSVPDLSVGERFVAYCYVADVTAAGVGAGSLWFTSPSGDLFDFICGASTGAGGVDWSPTPDGHPHSPLPYRAITTAHAIFVGSVVGDNIFQADSSCGGGAGSGPSPFSVFPFYRNGSQVIYDTATTCALTYTLDGGWNTQDGGDAGPWCAELIGGGGNGNWDLGIPTGAFNQTTHGDVPLFADFDFTRDGINDTLPISASQIILDSQAEGGNEPDTPTMCFMDPNVPVIDGVTHARSCQSELMVDAPGNPGGRSPYRPVTPYRARLNIGDAGTGYGVIWVGGAGAPPGNSGIQLYFDLAYRGYVEPERQLVPQVSLH